MFWKFIFRSPLVSALLASFDDQNSHISFSTPLFVESTTIGASLEGHSCVWYRLEQQAIVWQAFFLRCSHVNISQKYHFGQNCRRTVLLFFKIHLTTSKCCEINSNVSHKAIWTVNIRCSDLEATTLQANSWIYSVRQSFPLNLPCKGDDLLSSFPCSEQPVTSILPSQMSPMIAVKNEQVVYEADEESELWKKVYQRPSF